LLHDLFRVATDLVIRHTQMLQDVDGGAITLADEPEQNMMCVNSSSASMLSFFLRQLKHPLRTRGEIKILLQQGRPLPHRAQSLDPVLDITRL
jgi:hypothetical protein